MAESVTTRLGDYSNMFQLLFLYSPLIFSWALSSTDSNKLKIGPSHPVLKGKQYSAIETDVLAVGFINNRSVFWKTPVQAGSFVASLWCFLKR